VLKWLLDVKIILVMINSRDNHSYELNFNYFENRLKLYK